jgi:L-asparaginase / beta-aspartyl-peptidase
MLQTYTLALHGGAGTIRPSQMTPEKEKTYLQSLQQALLAGRQILEKGGTALDAVEIAVRSLEDCSLFNAGRGSVFDAEGKHEMEASLMCGSTLNAGAAAGIHNVRNPITLARRIMDHSPHVMLAGPGAETFARQQGIAFEGDAYFYSEYRYQQWQKARGSDRALLDHSEEKKFGTVGAVALDRHGNLAAATSTGGLTNKRWGRMGDTSLIGAGTYANNRSCAVSCTGYGEFFIRAVVAHDIACLMEYAGLSLQQACQRVVKEKLAELGGEGGVVAVDAAGEVELCFNSEGMYRGWISSEEPQGSVAIYK